MLQKWLLVLFLSLFTGFPSAFALRCTDVFDRTLPEKIDFIRFTQDFIGLRWVHYKLAKLRGGYEKWLQSNEKGTPESFIQYYVREVKPLPAIRDISGVIRLIDHHHSFYAIMLFLGTGRFDSVPVTIVKDYTVINWRTGKIWTTKPMMKDMKDNGFLNFENIPNPRTETLRNYLTRSFSFETIQLAVF